MHLGSQILKGGFTLILPPGGKKENMDIVNILSFLLIIKKNVIITLH